MKHLITGLVLWTSGAAFAGGGGLEEYYCSSPSHHVSVTLVTQLGSDLYKRGMQLEVGVGNTDSTYEIISYSDDGNLIQFSMMPVGGQPNLGLFTFSDVDKPQPKTVIQVRTKDTTVTADDVHCALY